MYFNASGKILTLTGNLFYGNTAGTSYSVVYNNGGSVSASHNVVDVELDQAGWTGDGDTTISDLPVSPRSFKLLYKYASETNGKLPEALPAGYPDTDFYGKPISGGGAAGAVQESTPNGYYYLDLSVNNSEKGTVQATTMPDADGLVPAGSVITANPTNAPNNEFWRWLVNGEKSTETSVSLTLSGHAWVQAMFRRVVTVSNFDNAGEGTLRQALTNANVEDGDRIQLSGPGTITLTSPLPTITKSLTIEGNGTTLIKNSAGGLYTCILGLNLSSGSDEALVRRLHFKNSQATFSGAVLHDNGNLTLESCIFSGNKVTGSAQYDTYIGGAVYSKDTLTIRGCTFYGNSVQNARGGAVYFNAPGKTLTLTGNLFYGNTPDRSVLNDSSSLVIASYNVVDKAFGTGETEAGWIGGTGNVYIQTGNPIDADTFAPNAGSPGHDDIDIVPPLLPDFPATDFNGTLRTSGAAGAVN